MDDMMKAKLDDIALDLRIALATAKWEDVITSINRLYLITGRYEIIEPSCPVSEPAPCCDPRLSNVTP